MNIAKNLTGNSWVRDLEKMKEFYETYFAGTSTELYHNKKAGFHSYFINFNSGSRLELMSKQHLSPRVADSLGYTHIALSVGTKADVDAYVEKFLAAGFPLLNGPRTTGDGYYEAVIQDPEGNLLELTTD